MSATEEFPHLIRKADSEVAAATFSHPWNPRSEIADARLSELGGLTRTGVSIARIEPGKESFAYHLDQRVVRLGRAYRSTGSPMGRRSPESDSSR